MASKKHDQELEQGISKLKSDQRVANIYVVGLGKPYQVARILLECQLDYFRSRLHPQNATSIKGDFLFPEDEADAWKVLLYWLAHQKLPQKIIQITSGYRQEGVLLAIRCWDFGERYGFKAFQDELMLWMLNIFENRIDIYELEMLADECVQVFKTTKVGSRLRDLFVEEVIRDDRDDGFSVQLDVLRWKVEHLIAIDGLGFFQLLQEKHQADDYPKASRFDARKCEAKYFWKNYMVCPDEKYEDGQYKELSKN